MSGGGRQNWHGRWITEPRELVDDAEDETEERYSATEIEQHLSDELIEVNAHDYDSIDSHRKSIEDALNAEFEVERIRFGGSHARSTDVVELSDVDILVSLDNPSDLPSSSNELIALLAQRLRQRFPRSSISEGRMAVTLAFSDGIEVQVLPAFRHGDTYKIPDANSSGWTTSNPTAYSRKLSGINAKCNGQVVPAIKLLKHLFAINGIGMKSYHVENMAIKAFEHFSGPYSNRNMLRHFVNISKTLVNQRIADPAGQSVDVSAYLTSEGRNQLSRTLARLETKLQSNSIGTWKELFQK